MERIHLILDKFRSEFDCSLLGVAYKLANIGIYRRVVLLEINFIEIYSKTLLSLVGTYSISSSYVSTGIYLIFFTMRDLGTIFSVNSTWKWDGMLMYLGHIWFLVFQQGRNRCMFIGPGRFRPTWIHPSKHEARSRQDKWA